jgi:SAM-dependent methyltransferase
MLGEPQAKALISSHYDERYFELQRECARFGSIADLIKFQDFVRPTDAVIDFGCGPGFFLSELNCSQCIGVEVNPAAQDSCRELGVPVVTDLSKIPDTWADVVISNHALEHTYDPFHKVRQVYEKLKPRGVAVFVVPCERHDMAFAKDDMNQHFYTWSPMNLGNLFASAGFQIIECREFVHRWPPKWEVVPSLLGWDAFHLICRLYGRFARRCSQVRVVARKP